MDTAYFYLTEEGKALAKLLSDQHPGDVFGKENFKDNLRKAFSQYDYLVCIMATGIVVRILAPLIDKKTSDPGVVVLDQRGQHAISLLSGHLGGANDLAREMAAICKGTPVITTATDVAGVLSFDTFAKKYDMAIENIGTLKHISGALLGGNAIHLVCQASLCQKDAVLSSMIESGKLLWHDPASMEMHAPGICVVIHEGFTFQEASDPVLYLRPRTLCAGIGCKRNMDGAAIQEALLTVLQEEHYSPLSLKCLATIPLKADEAGILQTASQLKTPLSVIPTEEIEALDIASLGIASSEFVAKQTGVLSVSTASAYLASGKGRILRDKVKFKGITIALAKMD